METARLIVCERTGVWSGAVRHHLGATREETQGLVPYETRNWPDCRAAMAKWPASLVALEVTRSNFADSLRSISTLDRRIPDLRIVACEDYALEEALEEAEWALREAGATDVVRSPRQIARVVRLAARHLANAPRRRLSVAGRIRTELPWA